MFKVKEQVYYKGSSEPSIPFEKDAETKNLKKKYFGSCDTEIISLIHDTVKMAVIKHRDGYDINIFVDAGVVPEKYRDSGITAIIVLENTLEKML